jgi:predicted nucleic acid-binding protein
VLVDTNVVLDVLLDREPHAVGSRRLWAALEASRGRGMLAAHALTTVHYLVSQARGPRTAREVVGLLMQVFEVAPVDGAVAKRALQLDFADFEDAVSAAAAEASGCGLVATRNAKDFKGSPVLAVDPLAAAAAIEPGPGSVSEPRRAYGKARARARSRAAAPSRRASTTRSRH